MAPIDRLGISNPTVRCVYMFALAFRVYHAVKNDYLTKVLVANNNGDYGDLIVTLKQLSEFHWDDIRPRPGHAALPL